MVVISNKLVKYAIENNVENLITVVIASVQLQWTCIQMSQSENACEIANEHLQSSFDCYMAFSY